MSEDHERRISTVEANAANTLMGIIEIKAMLATSAEKREAMLTQLAVVVDNQADMKQYQKDCNKERDDHEKRLTAVEGFQNRLVKLAVVMTGIGSLASPVLTKLWEKLVS